MSKISTAELHGLSEDHLVSLDQSKGEIKINHKIKEDFLRLQEAAAHAGVNLQIISGFRSYHRQLAIWNGKASGERELLNTWGEKIDFNKCSEEELLSAMLRWSAPPGLSRHHWGSDLDVFDPDKLSIHKVRLVPAEYEKGGDFFNLTNFLDKSIEGNKSFSFFRPYQKDCGGIAPELWHISHSKVAQDFQDQLTVKVAKDFLISRKSEIALSDLILQKIDSIFENYFLVNK